MNFTQEQLDLALQSVIDHIVSNKLGPEFKCVYDFKVLSVLVWATAELIHMIVYTPDMEIVSYLDYIKKESKWGLHLRKEVLLKPMYSLILLDRMGTFQ